MLLFLKPKTAKTSMFQSQKDSQVHDVIPSFAMDYFALQTQC